MTDDEEPISLDLDELGIEPEYTEEDMDPDRVQIERRWDDYRQGEDLTDTDGDWFAIDGVPVPAITVQGTDTSRFPPKQTTGAYNRDSDDIQSAWIQDNWGGGQLINKHISGGTDQRFRASCAWTMNAEQLALPPYVEPSSNVTDGDYGADYSSTETPTEVWNVVTPLARFENAAGPCIYYAIGCNIFMVIRDPFLGSEQYAFYVEPAGGPIELSMPPVNVGCVYGTTLTSGATPADRAQLYVPLGIGGHAIILDDDTFTEVPTHEVVAFVEWDNRLFALDTDGYLRYLIKSDLDPTGTWSDATEEMRIPKDQAPLDLELFYDRAGNQAVFVASDRQMWVYDVEVERLVETSLRTPAGRSNNFGFAAWRDDTIYVSSDTSVALYTRDGVKSPGGLDRDDGMNLDAMLAQYPNRNILAGGDYSTQYGTRRYEYMPRAPYIAHMAGSLNFLVAFVGRGAEFDATTSLWKSRMSIEVYNGAGWHTIMDRTFQSRVGFLIPGQLLVEDEVGGYRIWFGLIKVGAETGLSYFDVHDSQTIANYEGDVHLYSLRIPRTEHGPRQQIMHNLIYFEPDGYLYTGWFTAGMEGFDKTWSHFEIYLAQPRGISELKGYVDVFYRTKEYPDAWEFLGRAEQFGRTIMPFGLEEINGRQFSRGLSGNGIEFQYRLHSDDPFYQSPIVEATILKYIKVPLPGRAWLVTVPLSDQNEFGNGPQELDDFLSRKTSDGGFFPMIHLGRTHRVKVAQHQMIEGVGQVPFKQTTVNLIDVPIYGFSDNPDDNDGTE